MEIKGLENATFTINGVVVDGEFVAQSVDIKLSVEDDNSTHTDRVFTMGYELTAPQVKLEEIARCQCRGSSINKVNHGIYEVTNVAELGEFKTKEEWLNTPGTRVQVNDSNPGMRLSYGKKGTVVSTANLNQYIMVLLDSGYNGYFYGSELNLVFD